MDDATLQAMIDAAKRELSAQGLSGELHAPAQRQEAEAVPGQSLPVGLAIDEPDPTSARARSRPGVDHPADPQALAAMIAATPARIGVGRAGPRPRTAALLLFQADHAVTQDALLRAVDPQLLAGLGLFSVSTRVSGGRQEYLLRPDLGRQLSEDARQAVVAKCTPGADVQVCVGDGLSAAAIEANLRQILPVIQQGVQAAGLSLGVPFFIENCRVGVLNDIGELLHPQVVVLLIGERPGLGRAESMSAYMAYRPKAGDTDADREVVCNIFENGGTNPLEAGAVVVRMARQMIEKKASGIKQRLAG